MLELVTTLVKGCVEVKITGSVRYTTRLIFSIAYDIETIWSDYVGIDSFSCQFKYYINWRFTTDASLWYRPMIPPFCLETQ